MINSLQVFITDTCILKLLSVLLVIFLLSYCELNKHLYLSDCMHGNSAYITQIYMGINFCYNTSVFLLRPLYNLNYFFANACSVVVRILIIIFYFTVYKLIRNTIKESKFNYQCSYCLLKRKNGKGSRNCKHTLVKFTLLKILCYPKQIS